MLFSITFYLIYKAYLWQWMSDEYYYFADFHFNYQYDEADIVTVVAAVVADYSCLESLTPPAAFRR